jgi:rod shape-determining protein MreD
MIVTWRIALRIALIIVVAVVLQVSFLSYLWILGATPDVLPVIATCLGLLGGAVLGATCGFATGLLLDVALLETLGVTSLTLLLVGYLAGRYREGFEISNSLVPALLAGGLTVVATATFAVLQLMLGVETEISLLVLREVLVKALLALLLALPVYPLVRRALRPALVEEASRPRGLAGAIRPGGARRPPPRLRGASAPAGVGRVGPRRVA